ncbi:LPS translocon maturation chaperone LptM [Glaciimonas soli]|nr:lipoprotein [Glaciimonas soli]
MAKIASLLALSTLLTACGQKGPLYMPIIPPASSRPAITVPTSITPAANNTDTTDTTDADAAAANTDADANANTKPATQHTPLIPAATPSTPSNP